MGYVEALLAGLGLTLGGGDQVQQASDLEGDFVLGQAGRFLKSSMLGSYRRERYDRRC